MKKLALSVSILLFVVVNVFAQQEGRGAQLSEIRKNKNHLDLDIQNLFGGLRNTTLLYKRTFQMGDLVDVNAIRLFRFSGRVNNQITFTDDPTLQPNDTTNVGFHPSDALDFEIGFGIEKQKMNKNFVHYYGVDAIISFTQLDDDFSNGTIGGIINNATVTTDRFVKTVRAGINPFFGIKYYFTNHLSVGVETGISILYFNQAVTEVQFEQQSIDGLSQRVFVEDAPVVSNGIQTNFNNLRFLTIGYTF
ncbi:MAG: hypothetical protein AAGJ82_12650 [Bacteroidota bacterium]